MFSCGTAAVTTRYSSKSNAAGGWPLACNSFCHLFVGELHSFIVLFDFYDKLIIISIYSCTGSAVVGCSVAFYTLWLSFDTLSYPIEQMPAKI